MMEKCNNYLLLYINKIEIKKQIKIIEHISYFKRSMINIYIIYVHSTPLIDDNDFFIIHHKIKKNYLDLYETISTYFIPFILYII